jgi:hypothetical protein
MAEENSSNILVKSKPFSNALFASQWCIGLPNSSIVIYYFSLRVNLKERRWHVVKTGFTIGVGCNFFRKPKQTFSE